MSTALQDLEPQQLLLFVQSFGIPVSSMSKLLQYLDQAVAHDPQTLEQNIMDKSEHPQSVCLTDQAPQGQLAPMRPGHRLMGLSCRWHRWGVESPGLVPASLTGVPLGIILRPWEARGSGC